MDGVTVREGDIFLWTTRRLTRGQETVTRWWEEPEPDDGDQTVKIFFLLTCPMGDAGANLVIVGENSGI